MVAGDVVEPSWLVLPSIPSSKQTANAPVGTFGMSGSHIVVVLTAGNWTDLTPD